LELESGFKLYDTYPIIKQLYVVIVLKQSYIDSSIYIVLFFYIYDHVKNIFKHILLDMHDIQIITDEISLPIRKLLKNTLFYPIIVHTKTRKVLTRLKTKYNVLMLWVYIIQFFTRQCQWCNISFCFTF